MYVGQTYREIQCILICCKVNSIVWSHSCAHVCMGVCVWGGLWPSNEVRGDRIKSRHQLADPGERRKEWCFIALYSVSLSLSASKQSCLFVLTVTLLLLFSFVLYFLLILTLLFHLFLCLRKACCLYLFKEVTAMIRVHENQSDSATVYNWKLTGVSLKLNFLGIDGVYFLFHCCGLVEFHTLLQGLIRPRSDSTLLTHTHTHYIYTFGDLESLSENRIALTC